jgi:hypothetical protein
VPHLLVEAVPVAPTTCPSMLSGAVTKDVMVSMGPQGEVFDVQRP